LAGYAGSERRTTETHEPLEVSVLALFEERAPACVLISVDALFVGRAVTDACLTALAAAGVSEDRALIVASHTHFAPSLDGLTPNLGPLDPNYQTAAISVIVDAIREALAATPATGTVSRGARKARHAVNRRKAWPWPRLTRRGVKFGSVVLAPDDNGPKDERITALVFEGSDARTIVWHYACHPVGLPRPNALSSEFPGYVRRRLRDHFGENTNVLFLQGFAGDIRPVTSAQSVSPREQLNAVIRGPTFKRMTVSEWDSWAESLAITVIEAAEAAAPIETGPVETGIAAADLDSLLIGAGARRVEMQVLALGAKLKIIAVSAEPVIELTALCGEEDALLVGYSRDVFGYWPRSFQVAEGGYEVEGFKTPFSVPHPWRKDIDLVFVDLLAQARASLAS
jgi:neutral ceramidase